MPAYQWPHPTDVLVDIIEEHLHSNEIWFGASPGRVGPGLQNSLTGFRTTSAAVANTFGPAIVVLDGTETPVRAGMTYFDPHRIQVLNVENNAKTYRLRLASNRLGFVSWAAAVAAGVYSDVCFKIDQANRDASPFYLQTVRLPAGTIVWAAVATADAVAQWVDTIFGIHEYDA
ncbi:hypothetical protein MUO79_11580 [Candidatus Bathyarchaeota archaeon]|nr:hypothetical protein [Candidatus Bathyarchaeota archaeon]